MVAGISSWLCNSLAAEASTVAARVAAGVCGGSGRAGGGWRRAAHCLTPSVFSLRALSTALRGDANIMTPTMPPSTGTTTSRNVSPAVI